jgi:oligosaccharide repeat unit polymerase
MSWPQLYDVDAVMLSLFAFSYYRNCYRKGYRIDVWHAQLLFFCVFPYLVMLYFARSPLNAVIVGEDFNRIVAAVPHVFMIVLAGYLSVLVGGELWGIRLGAGIRKTAAEVLEIIPRNSAMLMSSQDLLVVLSLGCALLQSILLALYFSHNGFGFDLRAYTFANPGIRPFAQVTALSSVIVASHCFARYVDTRELSLLACALVLSFGLVFFGQRGNIFAIYMYAGLCYFVRLRTRVSLLKICIFVGVLLALVLYLGNAREGKYSISAFFESAGFLMLYGNNFTDLRDFAWVYSAWNHSLWLGKTYLAGLATFLPRAASDFRATWSFGIATGWTVGLDTETHPGLKPGMFGEAFFNFGWLGSIVAGLLYGIILRRVDIDVKAAMRAARPSMIKGYASTATLILAACESDSLNLPFFYALIGIYLFSWVYLRAKVLVTNQRIASAGA